MVTYINQNH